MTKLGSDLRLYVTNPFASHILETLLTLASFRQKSEQVSKIVMVQSPLLSTKNGTVESRFKKGLNLHIHLDKTYFFCSHFLDLQQKFLLNTY